MFGGLEIKGSSASTGTGDGSKKEEAASAPSSGFSFLNTAAPAPVASDDTAAAAAPASGSSGFSFLNSEVSAPAPAATVPAAESTPASGFSFLNAGAQPTSPASKDEEAEHANSGFSFLSNPDPSVQQPAQEINTRDSTSPAPSEVTMPDFLSQPSAAPPAATAAGVGVSFGTAVPANKPKKKRNRATKVGVHSNSKELPPRVPSTIPEPVPESAPPLETNTLQEAQQATQKAEEFLKQKEQQSIPGIATTRSEDEMIAAAEAAAEAAQNMNATPKRGFGNRLGGLFRINSGSVAGGPTITASTSSATLELPEPPEPSAPATSSSFQPPPVSVSAAPEPPTAQPPTTGTTTLPPELSMTKPLSLSLTRPAPPVLPPAPAPAPKQRTATDDYNDLMGKFFKNVSRTMDQLSSVRSQRNGLVEERFVTLAKERYATRQKASAEVRLQEAADAEDFEVAAAVDAEVKAHDQERAEYQSILKTTDGALEQLQQQQEELVRQVTKCFADVQGDLRELLKDQESKDTESSKEALADFSDVSKQLSIENDRLQQDMKHLERDAKLVADEREEVEASISEQAGEFECLRDTSRDRLAQVEQEMEELRATLAKKMKEATKLRIEAAGHDEAVLRVRVKFSRQLARVQKKETTVQDNQEEWALEKASYDRSKAEHDAKVTAHSEELLRHEKLLDTLAQEVDMAGTFSSIVAKEISVENEASTADDDLASMQAEVVKCEAAVGEAKASAKMAAEALAALEAELVALEAKLPQLEELKKAAAAKRDFKAAGQASKDVKEATARLIVVREELSGSAKENQETALSVLAGLEKELEEKRQVASGREKESGIKRMERLSATIKRLLATKRNVCAETEENSIQAVGAFVLDGQVSALRAEGQTYGDKYGGWDELVADLEEPSSPPNRTPNGDSRDEEDTLTLDTEKESSPVEETPPVENDVSKSNQFASFRQLSTELKDAEQELEVAVEQEDYEKAGELQETLERLMADLAKLDLTDEEMEMALSESPAAGDASGVETDHRKTSVESACEDNNLTDEGNMGSSVSVDQSHGKSESGSVSGVLATESNASGDESLEISSGLDNQSQNGILTDAVNTSPSVDTVGDSADDDI